MRKSNLYSPALNRLDELGISKFSIRGKTYNEVQSELAKINNFLNADTSTIRGLNNTLKIMADNTGIVYENVAELQEHAKPFFRLSDKVEEYLRTVDNMGSAVGYSKIWEAVNSYVATSQINLYNLSDTDRLDEMVIQIADLIKEEQQNIGANLNWFQLPK